MERAHRRVELLTCASRSLRVIDDAVESCAARHPVPRQCGSECLADAGGRARNLRKSSPLARITSRVRMAVAFLDFEQPIAELEAKIEELKLARVQRLR